LLPILLMAVLYFTNNLDAFIDKTDKELTELNVLIVIIYIFLFVLDVIKGWASNYISDMIFPGELKKIGQDASQIKKITKNVKDETTLIIEKQNKQEKIINDIYEQINLDPVLIKKYLEELKNNVTAKEKLKEIENWYINKIITLKEKKILLLIINHQKETIQVFNKRIKQLQADGNNNFAEALKNITIYLQEGNSEEIRNNYFEYIKKQKEVNVELLKSSINAAKQLFAYNEIKELYKELIKIEPTNSNHFDFAFLLQKFNFFDEAISQYEEALKIRRELAKENPRTYLPDVAGTLNNLAILHSDKNEFPQALEKYEEALKIRRELAKENPRTYLPDVAGTLNNLAVLHSAKNEFPQALEKYEEALKIIRELAKENPSRYEIDYAELLIMGVVSFEKGIAGLKVAKKMLQKYEQIPNVKQLLSLLEELEGN
jgi:tetratricopeptide (TPR) repeat protein